MAEQGYSSWAYSLVDSSQVSTFLISILLIVYGSFRYSDHRLHTGAVPAHRSLGLPACHVLLLRLGTGGLHHLHCSPCNDCVCVPSAAHVPVPDQTLLPAEQDFLRLLRTLHPGRAPLLLPLRHAGADLGPDRALAPHGRSVCPTHTRAHTHTHTLLSPCSALTRVFLSSAALAMGLCVAMIAFVRLPSLKVSCLLLSGLLIYDVFWVFFSAYIFNSNVMVKVATQPAENPIDVLSRKLHLGPGMGRDVPRLSLPGKLVFPSSTGSHFSMLGIGDIVMPGLLLCFVLRYDNYKKQANGEVPGPGNMSGRMQRVSYFHCTLIGYFVGLLTATVASRIHRAAQPALLYLVPFTLLPLLTMAYLKGDLRRMWSEPFHAKSSSSRFLEV
ncbi:unnamed protein product, partial [Tetraodon nigroviridis]